MQRLASALSDALDPRLGWYCDFRSDEETFVVFSGRIFQYRRGDRSGRFEAEAHARSVGVPETQIDWPDSSTDGSHELSSRVHRSGLNLVLSVSTESGRAGHFKSKVAVAESPVLPVATMEWSPGAPAVVAAGIRPLQVKAPPEEVVAAQIATDAGFGDDKPVRYAIVTVSDPAKLAPVTLSFLPGWPFAAETATDGGVGSAV